MSHSGAATHGVLLLLVSTEMHMACQWWLLFIEPGALEPTILRDTCRKHTASVINHL
jgi:hypothetical protein